jgi:chromosome segregation ATPase
VIQFALLFGLGFLTAVLFAMILAPAIHRRIVRYTENRIQATMPISPQEVRAQRDMARAVYAAENARTKQDLIKARDSVVSLQLRHDGITADATRLQSENHELHMQIDDMNTEASDLRSRLRREDVYIQQLRTAMQTIEDAAAAKDLEIETLHKRVMKLGADLDNLTIDLSTRDTEVENLKFRVSALREERDALRQEAKSLITRAKEAETRLTQEEHKALRLEDKLNREQADRHDKENALERRDVEINRLRDKVKTANSETRAANRALKAAGIALPTASKNAEQAENTQEPAQILAGTAGSADDLAALTQDIRNRGAALAERLTKPRGKAGDDAIRSEMASIAASMVALTAATEGPSSPIHKLLDEAPETSGNDRVSLADRAREAIAEHKQGEDA